MITIHQCNTVKTDINLHKAQRVYEDSGEDSKQLASKKTEGDNHSSL